MGIIGKLIGSITLIIAGLVGVVGTIFVLSLIPTLLWYCFDDYLAGAINQAWVGNVPFWNMYAFTLFVAMLFKSSSTVTTNSKKD